MAVQCLVLYSQAIGGPLSSLGLVAGMDVRGDGVEAFTQLVNSDPNDQYSPPYSGPDANGYYTLYLSYVELVQLV